MKGILEYQSQTNSWRAHISATRRCVVSKTRLTYAEQLQRDTSLNFLCILKTFSSENSCVYFGSSLLYDGADKSFSDFAI